MNGVILIMYQVTLYVLGICCFESLNSIEKEIKGLCGVTSFKSTMPKGKLVIEFKPSLVRSTKIIDRIKEQGFAVVKKDQKEYCFEMYN